MYQYGLALERGDAHTTGGRAKDLVESFKYSTHYLSLSLVFLVVGSSVFHFTEAQKSRDISLSIPIASVVLTLPRWMKSAAARNQLEAMLHLADLYLKGSILW